MSEEEAKNKQFENEHLVHLAQQGDQDAFAKLYDNFVNLIYRYVFYRVESAEAEDLVEMVFVKAWENLRQYKPNQHSFSSWIFRIAHNLVVDHYRSNKERVYAELDPRLPDQDRQHNPIKSVQNTFDNESLKRALSKMKKQYREIVIYKFINELSNSEIAEILGKSEGSLRILQFRALKALRKELEEMGLVY